MDSSNKLDKQDSTYLKKTAAATLKQEELFLAPRAPDTKLLFIFYTDDVRWLIVGALFRSFSSSEPRV